jgi:hypothetical protein
VEFKIVEIVQKNREKRYICYIIRVVIKGVLKTVSTVVTEQDLLLLNS